ncbi:MAG: hypothetical protein JSU65_14270 [Candidatus Zixiibacteriota bacterium]|nr:MAG: hypothetical protein JSU65_14270 [candidate division Zixibacteria bacterium]
MKAHIVQKDCDNLDIRPFLDAARAAMADLICFPELATTGCLYESREVEPLDYWLDVFAEYGLRIMIGLPLNQEDSLTNSYLYYHRGGCQIYNKINLFDPMNEDKVYRRGDSPGLFRTDLGLFGAAICYDIRFPVVFADLRSAGVDRIVIPAAFPRERIGEWRDLLVERARQTERMVIGVNAVGDDGTNEFGGSSMVLAPDGLILALGDEVTETVLEVEF